MASTGSCSRLLLHAGVPLASIRQDHQFSSAASFSTCCLSLGVRCPANREMLGAPRAHGRAARSGRESFQLPLAAIIMIPDEHSAQVTKETCARFYVFCHWTGAAGVALQKLVRAPASHRFMHRSSPTCPAYLRRAGRRFAEVVIVLGTSDGPKRQLLPQATCKAALGRQPSIARSVQ